MDSALGCTRAAGTSSAEPVTDADERDLLSRIAARDREAMRDFHVLYYRRLARFVARVTARRDVVDDIVDQVFVTVWQRAGGFRGDSRVSTWVMGIAWRHGLTSIQRERGRVDHPMLSKFPPDSEGLERCDVLARAISRLSPEHRALIELTYVGAYSCDEIGVIMNCPVDSLKRRLFDARCRLRAELEAHASSDGSTGRATLGADRLHPSAHGADQSGHSACAHVEPSHR
jgi:RNA polymerase sigma-70 factor (ECF subfamily)